MIDALPRGELRPAFLRRGAVVIVVLLALVGLGVFLTSRDDTRTARELCASAAGAQLAGPVVIRSADRTGDDAFLIGGTAGARSFTCLVTREPLRDRWEVASVS
ncbi:hypothetical protein AB0K00_54975 [Dactylosporangium sp. NPDC049525]|uniref:hypothetical protein n=1 Tax=Dactylosporangium sp. NPDC049525 TaxID=3154730 RepID=UPI00342E82A0